MKLVYSTAGSKKTKYECYSYNWRKLKYYIIIYLHMVFCEHFLMDLRKTVLRNIYSMQSNTHLLNARYTHYSYIVISILAGYLNEYYCYTWITDRFVFSEFWFRPLWGIYYLLFSLLLLLLLLLLIIIVANAVNNHDDNDVSFITIYENNLSLST